MKATINLHATRFYSNFEALAPEFPQAEKLLGISK
jgi:hypothetical protein